MTEWKDGIAKITLPTPFPVGDVNVYLLKGERLTLVDAGPKTEAAWESLTAQLRELNLRPEDIDQVILTHDHPDHTGLLDFFSDTLEVYGHPLNERWIHPTENFLQECSHFFKSLFHKSGLPLEFMNVLENHKNMLKYSCNRSLTGTLTEGMRPPGLSEWRVLETPGHAQSQVAYYREKDGIMLGGDLILAHISPNPLLEPPVPGESMRPKPQQQHNHSMQKLLSYPIQMVYTGHGKEVFQLEELVKQRLVSQHDRAMKVNKWLKESELTVFEICQRLFPSVYKRELFLTLSETIGQLDYLSSIGEIISRDTQPMLFLAK
ncbi:MBL fold metallo-hydrolase [Bacillus sp. BRMEA1]|uniref:MBL fold metallo-hydrolase n=1 Tax=Neobacillus endophyticus TaxID=2738405 RepID=UPI0015635C7B|nr:MBL fold metallo-hydrolase [Neobacillus endophyticus]NRD80662.1 MBL fold metallo-hydrolase [Neobacillus endophyticus]